MAFAKSSAGGRLLFIEDVTMANAGPAYSSSFSTPKVGQDFRIFLNTNAADIATTTETAEVQVSHDNVTWATVTSGAFTAFDTAMETYLYDASATGDAPYYRLIITSDADDSATVVKTVISLGAV